MKFKRRVRGTTRQIGKPFPLLEKKKLPPKIRIPEGSNRSTTAFAVCSKCGYEYNIRVNSKCPKCGSTIISAVRGGKHATIPTRAEQIARMMAEKPVMNIFYRAPENWYDGSISFAYGGDGIRNEVKLLNHDPNVASWDKHDNVVYIHRKIPKSYRKYVAIHESVEKYLKEKHGLDEYSEGHRAADEVERKLMTPQDWARYTSIVKRIHNEEKIRSSRLSR